MDIIRIISGELETNTYIVSDEDTKEALMIDPGYRDDRYVQAVNDSGLTLKGILVTHYHRDHTAGIPDVKKAFDVPVYVHALDSNLEAAPGEDSVPLRGGDEIRLGRYTFEVLHTPGHSRGSVCYYVKGEKKVFTGDTIFNVDLGATCFSGGSAADMKRSCREVVDKWEDDVFIYPGHGDGCTMERVREINSEFLEMIR